MCHKHLTDWNETSQGNVKEIQVKKKKKKLTVVPLNNIFRHNNYYNLRWRHIENIVWQFSLEPQLRMSWAIFFLLKFLLPTLRNLLNLWDSFCSIYYFVVLHYHTTSKKRGSSQLPFSLSFGEINFLTLTRSPNALTMFVPVIAIFCFCDIWGH